MKTINTEDELFALLDEQGRMTEPARLAEGCWLHGLTSVTSLDGLTMAEGCELLGLTSVTSLDGLTMAKGCWLSGLTSVTSLDGLTMAEGCRLINLPEDIKVTADPSPEELAILKRIPLDRLYMEEWHCGTSHCLYGWAQVLSGREENDDTVMADGWELLPSMAPYVFCQTSTVRRYLEKVQAA